VRALFISCLFLSLAHAAELRSWTDIQDRKVEATLLRIADQTVILKLKDGREVPYPLAKLSADDCKYVEENRARLTGNEAAKVSDDSGEAFNFDAPWPQIVKYSEDPEINIVEEDPEKKSFIYESTNYRYISDVRLAKSVVKSFAVLFEATNLYCRSLPLAINGGQRVNGKYQILLFEQFDDYVKAGGPANSSGVFISRQQAVLIPLASLGLMRVGSGYMLDWGKSSSTIPHELTHQLSPKAYFKKGADGWFAEGIAEYVGHTPYRSGIFSVYGNQKEIIDFVTGYGTKNKGGIALGKKIHMPALKTFILQNYDSFQQQQKISYGCGLLLTDYFLQMDGDGDGKRIKAFLKALHDGMHGEKSLDLLLDGRSFEKLQEDFAKAWSRKGIEFTFADE